MVKYTSVESNAENNAAPHILRENEDGSLSYIPLDQSNSDYQRYLRWLNGGEETGTIS